MVDALVVERRTAAWWRRLESLCPVVGDALLEAWTAFPIVFVPDVLATSSTWPATALAGAAGTAAGDSGDDGAIGLVFDLKAGLNWSIGRTCRL